MNQLEDRRPVAATTTSSNNPNVIGEDLAQLLLEHPDLELASVRLIPNDDGTVGIIGRRGPLTTTECPSCHTTNGHPHTDYCRPTWQVLHTNATGEHNQPWADNPCPTEWTTGQDDPWHRCALPGPHHTQHTCACGDRCELVPGGMILDEARNLLAGPDSP